MSFFLAETVTLRWKSLSINLVGTDAKGNDSEFLDDSRDLTLDFSENLYATDRYNYRVQKYVGESSNGIPVAGQSNGPSSIILDSQLNLYVAAHW